MPTIEKDKSKSDIRSEVNQRPLTPEPSGSLSDSFEELSFEELNEEFDGETKLVTELAKLGFTPAESIMIVNSKL